MRIAKIPAPRSNSKALELKLARRRLDRVSHSIAECCLKFENAKDERETVRAALFVAAFRHTNV